MFNDYLEEHFQVKFDNTPSKNSVSFGQINMFRDECSNFQTLLRTPLVGYINFTFRQLVVVGLLLNKPNHSSDKSSEILEKSNNVSPKLPRQSGFKRKRENPKLNDFMICFREDKMIFENISAKSVSSSSFCLENSY